MYADPEVMRHFPCLLTREESGAQVERFVRHWKERCSGLWAVEEKASGDFIGFVGLQHSEDRPEGGTRPRWDSVSTAPFGAEGYYRGRVGSLRYGSKSLGWSASSGVMEKAGLTYRGVTRWRNQDVVWCAIDRREEDPRS